MRRTRGRAAHNDEWHETEPGFWAAVAWQRRFRETGGCHAKAENIPQKKRSPARFGGKGRWGIAMLHRPGEHRDEFRDRQRRVIGHCEERLRRCNPALPGIEARFDCRAKPVIGRIRWLDSPAPHSVNRGSDEMHRPTGRRCGARIAKRQSRTHSSAGERSLHTGEVQGSIPCASTIRRKFQI